ncbi:hypothetical protein HPB50_018566 [Hyalomma asiaticum]|uniref:Uncharacterized protein n=1 Tax=Hyalomma asiaticum TaxID=266040 RepID=A0ACB7SX03_HYAAI|nr:hypothetical protein HPB50_018566 [Hyalomma asiaticum]
MRAASTHATQQTCVQPPLLRAARRRGPSRPQRFESKPRPSLVCRNPEARAAGPRNSGIFEGPDGGEAVQKRQRTHDCEPKTRSARRDRGRQNTCAT